MRTRFASDAWNGTISSTCSPRSPRSAVGYGPGRIWSAGSTIPEKNPTTTVPPPPCLGAAVGDHRAVEFLRPGPRRSPLEEQDGIGAAGDRLVTAKPHDAGPLRGVPGTPVDLSRRLLHEHPRPAATERAD